MSAELNGKNLAATFIGYVNFIIFFRILVANFSGECSYSSSDGLLECSYSSSDGLLECSYSSSDGLLECSYSSSGLLTMSRWP